MTLVTENISRQLANFMYQGTILVGLGRYDA
jgi:hypothetical protein